MSGMLYISRQRAIRSIDENISWTVLTQRSFPCCQLLDKQRAPARLPGVAAYLRSGRIDPI